MNSRLMQTEELEPYTQTNQQKLENKEKKFYRISYRLYYVMTRILE